MVGKEIWCTTVVDFTTAREQQVVTKRQSKRAWRCLWFIRLSPYHNNGYWYGAHLERGFATRCLCIPIEVATDQRTSIIAIDCEGGTGCTDGCVRICATLLSSWYQEIKRVSFGV